MSKHSAKLGRLERNAPRPPKQEGELLTFEFLSPGEYEKLEDILSRTNIDRYPGEELDLSRLDWPERQWLEETFAEAGERKGYPRPDVRRGTG